MRLLDIKRGPVELVVGKDGKDVGRGHHDADFRITYDWFGGFRFRFVHQVVVSANVGTHGWWVRVRIATGKKA